jgi:hypothetical protein
MTPFFDMVALSKALRQLHHEVLEVGLRGHAAAHGRIEDPFARLALVREDPSFEWIKPLTSALVDLDEALDAEDSALRAPAVLDRIQGLLTGKEPAFLARYRDCLQTSPEVAFAHGNLRAQLR